MRNRQNECERRANIHVLEIKHEKGNVADMRKRRDGIELAIRLFILGWFLQ
jgi:hypothetical protein